ncbi:MAG: tetratricopeptide repeat protein [Muribaculaceae bacterium]|nr:tetratricopeptide repeat protein [Muribaculaceae bacterium]
MKRPAITLLFILCIATLVHAGSPLVSRADSAYTADSFKEAAALYRQAIEEEGPSAKLYYNLGNACYRLGENGNAIIAYERALRLDPTDEDARFNLEFVNSRITDRAGERGTFIGNALDAFSATMLSDTWAWIAFACFALTLAGVMLYLFVGDVTLRKVGFFGGIVTFLISGVALFFASRSAAIAMSDDAAVITAPSTILSTAPRQPRDRSQEAMLLHEGTKVTILDSVRTTTDSIPSTWYDVQVDNTHRAWINASAVEKI